MSTTNEILVDLRHRVRFDAPTDARGWQALFSVACSLETEGDRAIAADVVIKASPYKSSASMRAAVTRQRRNVIREKLQALSTDLASYTEFYDLEIAELVRMGHDVVASVRTVPGVSSRWSYYAATVYVAVPRKRDGVPTYRPIARGERSRSYAKCVREAKERAASLDAVYDAHARYGTEGRLTA